MKGNLDSGIQEIFAHRIQSHGLWNPEFSARSPESCKQLESGIQIPPTRNPESSSWYPESMV